MLIQQSQCRRLLTIRMNPDDDVLQTLRSAVEEAQIRNGLILNGIGSIKRYHVHVVKTTNLPPGDVFFQGEGPFDILSITGVIINGRVHAHITFSNTEKAMGGHLEEGCQILTFGVVMLADTPELELNDWDRVGRM